MKDIHLIKAAQALPLGLTAALSGDETVNFSLNLK